MSQIESVFERIYDLNSLDIIEEDKLTKYKKLLAHLDNVETNCRKIGFALIEQGDIDLGHKLIVAGRTHDLSKFYNNEWEYLCDYESHKNSPELKVAITDHTENNFHHPEAWAYKDGIHSMPDEYLAEMVADWCARGDEFDLSIQDFLISKAFKKYKFSQHDKVFQRMNYFYRLLTGYDIFESQSSN